MRPASSTGAGVRGWSSPVALDRSRRYDGLGPWVRLVLLAALIAGLVAMHQVPSGDACCSGPAPSASVSAAHGPGHGDVLIEPAASSAVDATSQGGAGDHGLPTDMVGMCLAMIVAAGALLVVSLLLVRGGAGRQVPRAVVCSSSASPRGPPVPRRLAQLQVLRL